MTTFVNYSFWNRVNILHKNMHSYHALQSTSTMERSWGYNSGKSQYILQMLLPDKYYFRQKKNLWKCQKENNLWFLFEVMINSCRSIVCSWCQEKNCLLLSILMLCLLKKIKTKLDIVLSMFMYSPWVCLLMMGVSVADNWPAALLHLFSAWDTNSILTSRLFTKRINLSNGCDLTSFWTWFCLSVCLWARTPIWLLHFMTAVLLRNPGIIFCRTKAKGVFLGE